VDSYCGTTCKETYQDNPNKESSFHLLPPIHATKQYDYTANFQATLAIAALTFPQ
jgi:hypothetical protein